MDTDAIAEEIVQIRSRLAELDEDVDGGVGADIDDERRELYDRLRHLQDMLSEHGADHVRQDKPAGSDSVRYVPPA